MPCAERLDPAFVELSSINGFGALAHTFRVETLDEMARRETRRGS